MGRGFRAPTALLTLALALLSPHARAAFDLNDEGWEGASKLLDTVRHALGRDRVVPAAALDYATLTAADGVLILHPEVELDHKQLTAFMRAGGRVAVLDDHGSGDGFLRHFKIYRIRAPLRPVESLRDNPNLAIAQPAVQQVAGQEQGRHAVVTQVERLVTNHATALSHPDLPLTPVLTIRARDEPDAALAVTGVIGGRGRLLGMGDPSAVMNLMMRYPGNRAFARGVAEYLVADDAKGARGGRLYVLANAFGQSGHFGSESSWAERLGGYWDATLGLMAGARQDGLPEELLVLLAVVTAAGALAWVALTAGRTYRPIVPRYAAGTPLVAQGGVAGRAAVLAAPTTHRALALLELRSAVVEQLCERLGLPHGTATTRLAEEIDRQGALSRRSSEELKDMLAQLTDIQSRLAASQPIRVSARKVDRLRRRALVLLAELDDSAGAST